MNILVTGARAPATMDVMKTLMAQNNTVYAADSMHFPLGKFVKGLSGYYRLPKPSIDVEAFLQALKQLAIKLNIDLLFPTYEEIFYVSQGKEMLSEFTNVFCEPIERLEKLHNKASFADLVKDYNLLTPETLLLENQKDKNLVANCHEWVLKPVYSRFGSKALIKPTSAQFENLTLRTPHIAQRFVKGREISTYSIVNNGSVLIDIHYQSLYHAGNSTGIYFKACLIDSVAEFIKNFCRKYNFSGQIAFDFILKKNQAFVLECNPRLTSGFHMIAPRIDWQQILENQPQKINLPAQPYMLGQGMLMNVLKYLFKDPKTFIDDYRAGHDVLKAPAYPWINIKSLLSLCNILIRMLKTRKPFYAASTYDIDYDG